MIETKNCFMCHGKGWHYMAHAYPPGLPAPCIKVGCTQCLSQPITSSDYLQGVNTERLTQALSWLGVAGPVSQECYIKDMALYVNSLTFAIMNHKRSTEDGSILKESK